jgi:hypothetical protein
MWGGDLLANGPQNPAGRIGQGEARYRRKIVLESPQWRIERQNQNNLKKDPLQTLKPLYAVYVRGSDKTRLKISSNGGSWANAVNISS